MNILRKIIQAISVLLASAKAGREQTIAYRSKKELKF